MNAKSGNFSLIRDRASLLRAKIQFAFALMAIDLMAYTLAFMTAVWLRRVLGHRLLDLPNLPGESMRFGDLYFMPLLFLMIFIYEQLYQRRVPFLDEVRDIAKAIFILTVFLFALISLGRMAHLVSRLTILMMAPIAVLFLAAARFWGKIFLYKLGFGIQNLLIVGEPGKANYLSKELTRERTLGYVCRGLIPIGKLAAAKRKIQMPVLGKLQDIPRIVSKYEIECAMIATEDNNQTSVENLVALMHKHVEHVLLIPEMRSGAILNSELHHLFANQLFLLKMRNSLREVTARMTKMVFDYAIVILSFPVSIPFLLFIAGLIKITSKGPVLYTQLRVGQHGKTIRMYKFRSMFIDAEARLKEILKTDKKAREEWKKYHKLAADPRVTRLGNFLRRSSIDELPQLINVLLGNMSLVGPRPVPLDEFHERYGGRSDYYCLVRPGMTGLWQISGRSQVTFSQRIDMDTWYVFNWSLFLDLVILYKTLGVVLKKRGAY